MANSAIKITNIPVANIITLNSKFLSVEADVDRTQLITANDLVTYLANTALYKNQVNTTFDLANSAYNIANQSSTQANAAYILSTTSYVLANAAYITANLSYNQANAAFNHANLSFNQANSAFNHANLSFNQANAAFNHANLSFNQANAAFNHANLSFNKANSAFNHANLSFNQANAAFNHANLSFNQANSAFNHANLSFNQANAAFNHANLSFNQANTAYNVANDAYYQANSAFAQANGAYIQSNSALSISGVAFNIANSVINYYDAAALSNSIGAVYNFANTRYSSSGGTIDGSVLITGELSVTGNVTYLSANNLSISDNMMYLNEGSSNTNIDLGFAGNYNDGVYRHAGFFRDASDGVWKVFDQYVPEPDAAVNIDTSNNTFRFADFRANNIYGRIDASNVTSGTFNTARLGSGVANSTAYLAGDGTWKEINLSNINANNITSGTVNVAILGSGTANANTYLAGDNTWKSFGEFVALQDIGTDPNQIPLNQYLGDLAYQDASSISGNVTVGGIVTANSFSGSGTGLTGTASNLTANVANYEVITTTTSGTYYPQLVSATSGTLTGYANNDFVYDASGRRLGIGVSVPGYAIDVSSPQGILQLKSSLLAAASATLFWNGISKVGIIGVESSTGGTLFTGSSGNSFVIGTGSTGGNLEVYTNNSRKIVIDTSGNTVFGGSSTNYKLDVRGTANTGALTATTFSGNGVNITGLNADNISSGTVNVAILGSGTANASTYLAGDNTWKEINLSNIDANNITSGTVNVARLGSGTANASTYLAGDNTWKMISGFSSTDDTSTDATYYPVIATTAGGSTAKTSSTKLYFNPSTGTFSATVFNSLSDETLKKNIINISSGLEIIEKINAVEFEWIDSGQKSFGVIAQDLEKIVPELVTTDQNKTVNYSGLIAFLIKSVQELSNKVKELENK